MLLVERRGRVLKRDELIRELWPDTIVEEANVTFQVSTVRKALGEDGSKWIETVPKHGYRFTAPVREVRPENTRDGEALSMPPAAGARLGAPMWGRTGTGLALVAVVATFVAFWYASRPDAPVPSEIRLEAVPFTSYPGLRGGAHVLSGRVACGVHVGRREPGQSRHLRQGDRRGAAAPTDLRSRTRREPGLVARRHPDRLPPRQARGRLRSAPHPSHRRGRVTRSGRCRAWPTRGSRGFPTAAPLPSWIDRRPENASGSSF